MADVLVQNMTINLPLYAAYDLVQSQIGPFGSIDMKNVACPLSVKQLMGTGIDIIRSTNAANPTAGGNYSSIAAAVISQHFALPTAAMAISDWLSFGGNILCQDYGNTPINLGFQQYTSRQYPCGQWLTTLLMPTKDNVLVSAAAAGLGRATANINPTCALDTLPSVCHDAFLGQSMVYLQTFVAASDVTKIESIRQIAVADVRLLQPSLMQYVRQNATQPLQLMLYPLLDPLDPNYEFWSWLYTFEWSTGEREVIMFQGDVGSINLITEWTPPVTQQVVATEMPTTFTTYALGGVEYISGAMLGISGLILIFIVLSRGHIEPLNMIELNRVAGMVWVGRPLLLLRGVTAICLLSTATLELSIEHDRSYFSVPILPWYKTILGAGESGWLCYILNDIVMVWTKQYTSLYATGSSILVWIVAAALTLATPVVHQASIHADCQVDQMDFQVVCQSGVVAVGQASRLYWLLTIVAICNAVSYTIVRIVKRNLANDKHHFPLLTSGATNLFERKHWMYGGTYYLDPASAILNGLVSFRWGQTIYAMDIKLWRHFTFKVQDGLPPRFQSALPLGDSNALT
ncbi:Aste57867_5890 [Aphanomyces stellatus]|uniref:Aste57867_5890 protein n=1 Tax=Aphanomyces stellatus TaxID=120398 RepID=A0A485KDJ9_9STRA|nr:hypothetical protein As57867_005876 [Aphanomyces stellatus]VFT82911.1 Aste57867_5890 [Aphanomyces stellatus]